jgi:hypothetical protein
MAVPAIYPAAAQRPVSYAGSVGTFSATPLGWILHVVVGDGSPWGTFEHAPAGSRRFSHLWVAKTGAVEQYQRLDRISWAQAAGNSTYWSVETEGFSTEPLTDAQLDALAAWHAWCGAADQVANAPGQRGIGTHEMGGAAWGGHACPGPIRAAQRAEIIRRSRGGDVATPAEVWGYQVGADREPDGSRTTEAQVMQRLNHLLILSGFTADTAAALAKISAQSAANGNALSAMSAKLSEPVTVTLDQEQLQALADTLTAQLGPQITKDVLDGLAARLQA